MKYGVIRFSRQLLFAAGGISKDLIKKILDQLPLDATLVGFGQDLSHLEEFMAFQSDSYKDVPDGHLPPDINATFTRNFDGSVDVKIDDSHLLELSVPTPLTLSGHSHGGYPTPIAMAPSAIKAFEDLINEPKTKHCIHNWKKYQGLSESYDYCEYCNIKK